MRKNLTKEERIKKRNDIQAVFMSSFQTKSDGIRLKYIENGLGFCRFAVSLVKRYGNSIKRNKAKRVVREVLRLEKYKIIPGFDILLIVYPVYETFSERRRQILLGLEKAELIKSE